MAGHSKWANIQHRKNRQDAKRGKIFTRLIKEITVAARLGGGDITHNPRLRMAIDKAKAESMPKENIENAVKRGSGNLDGANYEEIRYEGYGIGGASVIVDCMTDNRNRTAGNVRHAFTKYGGNLGTDGSVAFMFRHCGFFVFPPESNEEQIMELAISAGAEDIITSDDGSTEIISTPDNLEQVKTAFTQNGLIWTIAEITMKADNEIILAGEDGAKMQKLLDALDDLDDVQEVYTSAIIKES